MSGGQRAIVAGVHRLQHVERFAAAHLADDDTIRAHTQRVSHQIANGDLPRSLQVRGSCFQREHMRLLQLNFRRVLDGHDALVIRDVGGKNVQQRGFSATGTAGYDDVEPALDAGFQKRRHLHIEAAEVDQIFHGQRGLGKFTNCEQRPFERERRNHRVDAGAVGQTRIHHRVCFVNVPSERGHDAVDDVEQLLIVVERDVALHELALALNKHLLRAVDHDFTDGFVR